MGAARATSAVISIAVCTLLVGCGGGSHPRTTSAAQPVPEPVRYLPGGLGTIAAVDVPGAGRLVIRAKRYRFHGHVYFNLSDFLHERDGSGGGSDWRPEGHAPLAWTFDGQCPAAGKNATVIVYGLLRAPADTAFVYAAHAPHRMRTAAIPARFRAGGVAAYAWLGEPPERILVRTPAGKIAMDERLGREGPVRCDSSGGLIFLRKKT